MWVDEASDSLVIFEHITNELCFFRINIIHIYNTVIFNSVVTELLST